MISFLSRFQFSALVFGVADCCWSQSVQRLGCSRITASSLSIFAIAARAPHPGLTLEHLQRNEFVGFERHAMRKFAGERSLHGVRSFRDANGLFLARPIGAGTNRGWRSCRATVVSCMHSTRNRRDSRDRSWKTAREMQVAENLDPTGAAALRVRRSVTADARAATSGRSSPPRRPSSAIARPTAPPSPRW